MINKSDYFDKISANYIQEWFANEPVTQSSAVESIINAYPLPSNMTKNDITEWVAAEVSAYNDLCDSADHYLPTV